MTGVATWRSAWRAPVSLDACSKSSFHFGDLKFSSQRLLRTVEIKWRSFRRISSPSLKQSMIASVWAPILISGGPELRALSISATGTWHNIGSSATSAFRLMRNASAGRRRRTWVWGLEASLVARACVAPARMAAETDADWIFDAEESSLWNDAIGWPEHWICTPVATTGPGRYGGPLRLIRVEASEKKVTWLNKHILRMAYNDGVAQLLQCDSIAWNAPCVEQRILHKKLESRLQYHPQSIRSSRVPPVEWHIGQL